jgi:hypothetical protein
MSTVEITGDDVSFGKKWGGFYHQSSSFRFWIQVENEIWAIPPPFTGTISLWLIRWAPFGV